MYHFHLVYYCSASWIKNKWASFDIFSYFFTENWLWHFMKTVSLGDNLHEMSNPIFTHFMQIVYLGDNLREMSNPILWNKKWEKYYQFVCLLKKPMEWLRISVLPKLGKQMLSPLYAYSSVTHFPPSHVTGYPSHSVFQ